MHTSDGVPIGPVRRAIWKYAFTSFPGVSWKHPLIAFGLRALDPVHALLRHARGLSHLPPYSVRVRANGVRGQLGGARFRQTGQRLRELLQQYAGLTPTPAAYWKSVAAAAASRWPSALLWRTGRTQVWISTGCRLRLPAE